MDEEKVKIKLTIAGETFRLSVPYSKQDETRETEAGVNALFDTWRNRFPDKSDRELLAMIAFRYADRYAALKKERETALRDLDRMAATLGEALALNAE